MVSWPFIIWAGIVHGASFWLAPVLALFFLLRFWLLKGKMGGKLYAEKALSLTGVALCSASLLLRDHQLLLFYPVAVNVVLLLLFGSSLLYGMPIVEQIARLGEPDLPPKGVTYTRKVTQVWCVFFIINGSISLATCLHNDIKIWTLWNGFLSYLFIGTLMGVEWLVRQRVKK
ncbi:hypothetical protein ACMV8I_16570 [Ewingella sp. S1.OA.A_B6]